MATNGDEALMHQTLATITAGSLGFRVSAEHYRYLGEQIMALRAALDAIYVAGSLGEANERARLALRISLREDE